MPTAHSSAPDREGERDRVRVHAADAGQRRHDRADAGEPPADHHGEPAVAGIHPLGRLDEPPAPTAVAPRPAEPAADSVAETVAEDGAEPRGRGQNRDRHVDPARAHEQARTEEQRVAGQEDPDEQPGLDHQQPEHDEAGDRPGEREEIRHRLAA
jgi:hypothetical protein